MSDFGAPVAQNVNVNTGGGLDMLSKLLSLKQAKQNLDTGAIQQQGLQAEVQQQQQTATQRSAQASFFQNWDPTQHVGDDGTLDLNSAFADPKLRKAAGDQFPDIAQKLIQVKQGQLTAKGQLATLNGTVLGQIGQVVGGLREDPDVRAGSDAGFGKVANALSEVGAMGGPDAQRIVGIFSNGLMKAPRTKGANGQSSLWNGVNALQLQAMDASTQAARQAPSYLETPEGYQQTNPQNGAQPAQPGAPAPGAAPASAPAQAPGPPGFIRKGLSPTQQPGYMGGIAGIPEDQARYGQISAGTQSARATVALADQVAALSDQVRTGKYSKTVTDYAALIGQRDPSIAARQLLDKYAAQLKIMGSNGATTDSARAGVEHSLPNPETMTPEAVKEAARYIAGVGDMNLTRSQRASAYVQGKGSANGLRAHDDSFTGQYAPEDFAYRRMPSGPERQRFLLNRFGDGTKITDVAGAKAFVSRQQEIPNGGR